MPYEIELTGDGLWSWVDQNPGSKGAAKIIRIYRAAHKQVFTEFMTGTCKAHGNDMGIGRRFTEGYGQIITRRSDSYIEKVKRFYGRYLPFTSPTTSGTAATGHLRDLVKRQGVGFNLRSSNKSESIMTIMTLPAARRLNFRPQYRREFLALDSINRGDGEWMEKRVHAIAWPLVKRQIELAERRRIRGAKV